MTERKISTWLHAFVLHLFCITP